MFKLSLIITIIFPLSLICQINENEFYNTTDLYLKIHKINPEEYLFYGNKGGIVRTYDSGDNYIQNYSGTTNNILNLANHKVYVVGITDKYEFMASQDKGSHWNVRKLKDSIVSMDANDSYIVLASFFEDILISSDVGKTWNRISVKDKYFRYVFIIEDRIFTIDKNNSIDYTDDYGKSWNNIETPTELKDGQFISQRDEQIITMRNKNSFFRINTDLSISNYKLETESIHSYKAENDAFIFANANSGTREIKFYKYGLESKSEELIYSYYNVYFYGNTFRIYDIEIDENIAFMTLENRTIMKSIDNGETWEVVTHTPILDSGWPLKVFDENNWSIISNSLIYKSTNGGVTFKPGKDHILDTIDGSINNLTFSDFHYYNRDSAVFLINTYSGQTNKNEIYTTSDGGETLVGLDIDIQDNLSFVSELSSNLFLQGQKFFGRGKSRVFYRIDKYLNVDSINVIDSVYSNFIKTINYGSKIYVFYSKDNYNGDNTTAKILVSNDSLNTFIEIYSSDDEGFNRFSNLNILRSKNGNIYFALNSVKFGETPSPEYFRLESETDQIYKMSYPLNIYSGYYTEDLFIEDQRIFNSNTYDEDNSVQINKYVEVNVVGSDIKFDTLGSNNKSLLPLKILGSEKIILTGTQYKIYKQIEPDRLVSVEQIESRTENLPIYPFAPSPNPAKDMIKVNIYTESIEKIDKLKVHLINITSGAKTEIKNYEISFNNNWDGEIRFDVSGFSIGSYLINLSIDDYNRSSKLIITK